MSEHSEQFIDIMIRALGDSGKEAAKCHIIAQIKAYQDIFPDDRGLTIRSIHGRTSISLATVGVLVTELANDNMLVEFPVGHYKAT
jgi:hypothetical protein